MARRRNNPSTAFSEDTIPEADFLDSRGYRLMSDWTWEHPTAKPTEEDHAAAQVLMDEWGYGPIRRQRAKRAKAKLPPKKQAQPKARNSKKTVRSLAFQLPKAMRDMDANYGPEWERAKHVLRNMGTAKLVEAVGKKGAMGKAAMAELDRRGRGPDGKKTDSGIYAKQNGRARKNGRRRDSQVSANWTSYPEYSYEQFYRENPSKRARKNRRKAKKNPSKMIQWAIRNLGAYDIGSMRVGGRTFKIFAEGKGRGWFVYSPTQDWIVLVEDVPSRGGKWSRVKPRAYIKSRLESVRKGEKPVGIRVLDAQARDVDPSQWADLFDSEDEVPWLGDAHEAHGYALKNSGLKLGRAVYDEMPTNAGPYLPQIFPYGQGGRPATYKR